MNVNERKFCFCLLLFFYYFFWGGWIFIIALGHFTVHVYYGSLWKIPNLALKVG